jgi:hypothetical protein
VSFKNSFLKKHSGWQSSKQVNDSQLSVGNWRKMGRSFSFGCLADRFRNTN